MCARISERDLIWSRVKGRGNDRPTDRLRTIYRIYMCPYSVQYLRSVYAYLCVYRYFSLVYWHSKEIYQRWESIKQEIVHYLSFNLYSIRIYRFSLWIQRCWYFALWSEFFFFWFACAAVLLLVRPSVVVFNGVIVVVFENLVREKYTRYKKEKKESNMRWISVLYLLIQTCHAKTANLREIPWKRHKIYNVKSSTKIHLFMCLKLIGERKKIYSVEHRHSGC